MPERRYLPRHDYGQYIDDDIIVDAEDYNDLNGMYYYYCARHKHIYCESPKIGIKYILHRLIAKRHGIDGKAIVHINGDPRDCRSVNLRGVTQKEALQLARDRRLAAAAQVILETIDK